MTAKTTIPELQGQIKRMTADHQNQIRWEQERVVMARDAQRSAEAALKPLQEELQRCRAERNSAREHELEAARLRGVIEGMEKNIPGRSTSKVGEMEYQEERFRR